jgi:hypothetical protein
MAVSNAIGEYLRARCGPARRQGQILGLVHAGPGSRCEQAVAMLAATMGGRKAARPGGQLGSGEARGATAAG